MKKIFFFLLSLFLFSCSNKQSVDLIVFNAVVYIVDSSFTTAQSFAVKDGKFIAIGKNQEIQNKYSAKETIDAKGKAVYPGLIDAHCHFYGYGKGLNEVNLVGTKSFDEVIKRLVSIKNKVLSKDGWIIGRGWDQNDWAVKEFPDKTELDSLFPNTPVFLQRIDGHAALVNSEAMKRAGISGDEKIEGGTIESFARPAHKYLEGRGEVKMDARTVTGILIDNAVDLVTKVIPKPSSTEIKNALLAAEKNCFAAGLTTVDDAGLDKNIVDAMDSLQKANLLKMRIYAMLTDSKENLTYYLKHGHYKSERLNVRSFKYYADGALGSRGACLLKPYSDKPLQPGFLLKTPQYYDSVAKLMYKNGWQMNTHCIGDSAVRLISKVYRYCNPMVYDSTNGHEGVRWRIEHFQVTTKKDIEDVGLNNFPLSKVNNPNPNIIPSIQPTHATSDMYWAEERLGKQRIKYAYAYNDLLNAAGMIALGTDFPVEDINPMYTFYSAVARKDLKGFPKDGFQMENALSRENTLKGMTTWAAYANFEEHEKGSIEAGKFADFIITDTDIMKCDINKVPSTKVISTFVNGECVYKSE